MFNINNFLEKFKNLTPPNDDIKKETIKIISNILSKQIDKNQLIIKNNIIYIKTTPVLKNEIFIKKTIILDKLKKTFNKKAPKNIL